MESAPLLGQVASSEVGHDHDTTKLGKIKQHFARWRTLYICVLFLSFTDLPSFMGEGPMLRMLELGACREYYTVHDPDAIGDYSDIPERLCKLPEIQSRVARLRSLMAFVEAAPGLLLAIPYGILADTRGRPLVVGLCLLGILLRDIWIFICLYFYPRFPLDAVCFAPITAVIGGGSTVTGPMFFAIVAASTPQESRAHAFFMIQVCLLALESLSPLLGSLLMESIGPYYAWLVVIPLESLGFSCVALLPCNSKSAVLESESTVPESAPAQKQALPTVVLVRLKQSATGLAYHLSHDVPKLFQSRYLIVAVLAKFIAKMARPVKDIMPQFMTAKFKLPISQANMITSLQAAAQLPWFMAILPAVYAWMLHWKRDAIEVNRILAISLVCCLALGVFCMGIAPTPATFIMAVIVYTAGSGFSVTMRSLLTALVADDQLSLLFTCIAVFEAAALLTAAPMLQLIFSWGLQNGGLMMSLPFLTVALLYGCAGLALSLCKFQ